MGNGDQAYPFSQEQRLWIAIMKEKGKATSKIKAEFNMKLPAMAPLATKATIYKMWLKLKEHHTVKNHNKDNSDRKRTGRSEENIILNLKFWNFGHVWLLKD